MKCKLRLLFLVAGVAVLCNSVFAQTVDQGRKFYYYKRYKSAKDVFDKVLAANPNNIEAIYWDGQTLLAMKDSVAARDLYSKALQTNGNAPLLLAGMGGVELRFGKTQDARSHFDMALQLSKNRDVPVFNAVAKNNIEAPQGDIVYALEKLNAATNVRHFNDADTYVLMGDAYRRLIDGGNAVQAYQKALSIDPKDAEAEYQIGKIYLTQNNVDYFLPAFQKAVEMDPAYAPAYYELFYYYYNHWNADNIPKATDALNKYIANSDPGPNVDMLQTDFLIVTGKFADAKAKAQAIIAADGDKVDPLFYAKVAYCCDTLGDAACAQQNINTFFVKQDPAALRPLDYVLRASIEGKSTDSATREQAFIDYGTAIQKDTLPEEKAKYLAQAENLANKLGDKKALASIARIVYMGIKDPTNSDVYKFGIAYYLAGDYKTADSVFCGIYESKFPDEIYGYLYCMRSKALEDDSVGSQGLAVDAEMKLAEFGRAKDSVAKAAGNKDSTQFKRYVIDCYQRLAFYFNNTKDDRQQAIFWLQKILEVDPDNADAKKYIAMLTRPPRKEAAAKPKSGR
ncbi:MAG TPA: tetratricopeptide repeat protein [Puia sp.]|nr:tetratricopeptide repeat protein [Puia sp.]